MQKNKTHIEQFIGNVEELLRIDTPYATHGLRTLGGGSNDVSAHSGKREKIRKLSDQVVESGNRLAESLESTGHESTDVLTIVSFLKNGESHAVRKTWPETKIRLKRLAIQANGDGRTVKLTALSKREKAVYDIIPKAPDAIILPDLLDRLAKKGMILDDSAITKDIMPRLKKYYGVENRKQVGYFRPVYTPH